MKLRFVWVGKTRNGPIAALIGEYLERASRFIRVSVDEIRDAGGGDKAVARVVEKEGEEILARVAADPFVVALDERGVELSSAGMSDLLENHRLRGTRQVTFVIGGFGGLSEGVRRRADMTLSLSRMTFTHEMARLVLAEQIYRGLTIINRVPYQK
ncbi:MAG TPA: 23S rRNA (pseudouridine(1915)-N(3))-methyltransferase RlmH [Blastocatellia bacterium]|nr:23S rRNA (pseudouridine(1915)-N(3))-methyltransferase RlmH [Blastocatellia bacterium]